MNSLAVPSAVVTLGRLLGPKKSRSFNRVDGILTKVRDLQNQHLHPVATLPPFQCSSSRVRVIRLKPVILPIRGESMK